MLRLIKWALSRLGTDRSARSNLLSPEKFQQLLSRECARADRNAHGFSLVIFDVAQMPGGGDMVGELSRQIRFFDVVGWIDHRRVGVFLPETLHEGAQNFVSRLREQMHLGDLSIQPSIKCYTGAIAPALAEQAA